MWRPWFPWLPCRVWSAHSTVTVSPEVVFSTAPLTVDHIPRPSTVVLRLKGDLSEPPVGGCLTTGKWTALMSVCRCALEPTTSSQACPLSDGGRATRRALEGLRGAPPSCLRARRWTPLLVATPFALKHFTAACKRDMYYVLGNAPILRSMRQLLEPCTSDQSRSLAPGRGSYANFARFACSVTRSQDEHVDRSVGVDAAASVERHVVFLLAAPSNMYGPLSPSSRPVDVQVISTTARPPSYGTHSLALACASSDAVSASQLADDCWHIPRYYTLHCAPTAGRRPVGPHRRCGSPSP